MYTSIQSKDFLTYFGDIGGLLTFLMKMGAILLQLIDFDFDNYRIKKIYVLKKRVKLKTKTYKAKKH